MIADCHRLGYLNDDDYVLDPTYGLGRWWTIWAPALMVVHDLAIDGVDFRHLPEPDDFFDAVAFDPPYVSKGGRTTSGIVEMDERYGQVDYPATPLALQVHNDVGLAEMYRVVRPEGIVLAKCKDYISSGKLWLGVHRTMRYALGIGFEVVDILEFITGPGPQPRDRRQVHARRNLSTLLVLRKGRRA